MLVCIPYEAYLKIGKIKKLKNRKHIRHNQTFFKLKICILTINTLVMTL